MGITQHNIYQWNATCVITVIMNKQKKQSITANKICVCICKYVYIYTYSMYVVVAVYYKDSFFQTSFVTTLSTVLHDGRSTAVAAFP